MKSKKSISEQDKQPTVSYKLSSDKFWNKWLEADELEKQKMVETLTIMDMMVVKNGSMLNSYFIDLEKFVRAMEQKDLDNCINDAKSSTIEKVLEIIDKRMREMELEIEITPLIAKLGVADYIENLKSEILKLSL